MSKIKKYSNKELLNLVNTDLIFVKSPTHYDTLLRQSIEEKGWDYSMLQDDDQCNDIIHDELWFDACDLIRELAQLILNEREKKKEFIKGLEQELKYAIKQLSKLSKI